MENFNQNGDEVRDIFQTPKRQIRKAKNTGSKKKEREHIEKEKVRTPSGQSINTSVKDIRNFFSSFAGQSQQRGSKAPHDYNLSPQLPLTNTQARSQSKNQSTVQTNSHTVNSASAETTIEVPWRTVKRNQFKNFTKVLEVSEKQRPVNLAANRFAQLYYNSDQSSIDSFDENEEDAIVNKPQTSHFSEYNSCSNKVSRDFSNYPFTPKDNNTDVRQGYKDHEKFDYTTQQSMTENIDTMTMEKEIENEVRSRADPDNPQLMDIQVVIKMFGELKKEISDIKTKKEKSTSSTPNEVDNTNNIQEELNQYKAKTETLISVVERMGCVHQELQKRVEIMELRSMRKSVVISGLHTDNRIMKCILQVENFILKELGLEVTIIDCFKLGIGETKPVVFTLETLQEKTKIYQMMDKYRKAKALAKQEVTISISDFMPAELKEQKRRERDIYKTNERDQSTKISMNLTRTGLEIQGEKYEKRVVAPDSTKVLSYTEEQLSRICKLKLQHGVEITENGSSFVGFVLPANNHESINDVYMKLRLVYPQAKHIICAYSIPGLPRCYHEDYCDDKEVGAGNYLLKLLQNNKITCMAFFVVRIQNGPKIGPKRFELMAQAVQNALGAYPFNKFVNANQQIDIQPKSNDYWNSRPESIRGINPPPLQQHKGHRGAMVKAPVKGNHYANATVRGTPSRARGGPNSEPTKRRRYDSNGQQTSLYSPSYGQESQFMFNPPNFQFAPPKEATFGTGLGDSWPTLHQSSAKWK